MRNIQKWSKSETSLLQHYLSVNKSKKEIAILLRRSIASINDRVYRIEALSMKKHNVPWTVQEDMKLISGMGNKTFSICWERGSKK